MQYPGGKNLNGIVQRLINQIPPHRVYIETHLGSGAVMRHKRPAVVSIGVDIDAQVLAAWPSPNGIQLFCQDAIAFLEDYAFEGDEFVYVDPPYLPSTRQWCRSPYRYDYTERDHVNLLECLLELPCAVMVSGYFSGLYDDFLQTWRRLSFPTRTRSGARATEWLWMNYPEPTQLHDYRYLGDSFRERERIRRRLARWKSRFDELPPLEQQAFLSEIGKRPT